MPVVVLGVVAVYDTTAAGHMNSALDYCSQQTSPLLSILSIYYMNNSLFPFLILLNSAFSRIMKIYYSPIKYPVIVSMMAAAPAIANNASNGSATIGIQLYKTNKKH